MQSFTVRIPVKPHLKKYIECIYGNPIRVSLQNDIGHVILTTLSSRMDSAISRDAVAVSAIDAQHDRIREEILVVIPFHLYYRLNKDVTPYNKILLNRYFQTCFDNDMFFVVTSLVNCGISRKQALERFADQLNIVIDEDISMDALIKSDYRMRQKNLKKILRDLSTLKTAV